MWENIMLSIASSISEAICSNLLERRKRNRLNKKINTIVEQLMNNFADTSLDCDAFYYLVNSNKFSNIIKNYYYSLKDRKDSVEYLENVEKYILIECPSLNFIELREFIKTIGVIYENYLHKIIEETPELSIVFQLLTISHREIIGKIAESEGNLLKYLHAQDNATRRINNEDIKSYHDVCEKDYSLVRFTGISGAERDVSTLSALPKM